MEGVVFQNTNYHLAEIRVARRWFKINLDEMIDDKGIQFIKWFISV